MGDKKRIKCFFLDEFFESVLGHFEIGESWQNLETEIMPGALPALLSGQLEPIFAGNFADNIDIAGAPPWSLQIDRASNFPIGTSMLDFQ